MTNCTSSLAKHLEKQAIRAEVLFSGFLAEHNLTLATADHMMSKPFKSIFPDSQIASKCKCGRTMTLHILTGTVAKKSHKIHKGGNYCCILVWIAHTETEVVMRVIYNFLPTLIRHFGKDSGFVETLLDMLDINSCSTAEQMFETTCDTVIKSFSLDWSNCFIFF